MKVVIAQDSDQAISVHTSYNKAVINHDEDTLLEALTDGTLYYKKAGKTILSIKNSSNGLELFIDDYYVK